MKYLFALLFILIACSDTPTNTTIDVDRGGRVDTFIITVTDTFIMTVTDSFFDTLFAPPDTIPCEDDDHEDHK